MARELKFVTSQRAKNVQNGEQFLNRKKIKFYIFILFDMFFDMCVLCQGVSLSIKAQLTLEQAIFVYFFNLLKFKSGA